jgi:NADPH2:quinone reductase
LKSEVGLDEAPALDEAHFMRAIVCHEFGAPLTLEEQPDPQPGPGQLLVEIAAAGLNYVDALFVRGEYQIKPPLPFVPGSEIAGTVSAVGEGAVGFEPGDRVLAMTGMGGFAEKVLVAASAAVPVPDALSDGQAGALVQSYSTALFALRERGRLCEGESLLVLGAAGGVGRAAIDVGKALGARVIAAASTEEKLAACRVLGADECIRYGDEDLKTRVRELTDGGVDVVFDPVGAAFAEPALRATGVGGRYLVIGFAGGAIPKIPLNQVLLRNRNVVGVDWGAWMLRHGVEQRALLEELLRWASEGRLHPSEPARYPLEDAQRAIDDLLNRRINGKAALIP